jgi:hypothetical protein
VTGALIWIPALVVVLAAMRSLAGRVLDAGAEWAQVRPAPARRTAGEAIAGLGSQPGPSPAVATPDGCTCPGCECARLLETDGGQS